MFTFLSLYIKGENEAKNEGKAKRKVLERQTAPIAWQKVRFGRAKGMVLKIAF